MLDRCQGLLFKNFFYDAACDSKSLNCNIIMQKRFFWLLRQLLTNLYFPSCPSTIQLFPFSAIFFIFPPPPPPHFYCFPFSLILLFCLLRLLFISHCFPPPSRPHSIVPVPLLISIVFRPFSPHFYCFPSTYFCCFHSSSSFLLFCLLLLIHHFHIDQNPSCLPPPRPPPPKKTFSTTIVSNFPRVVYSRPKRNRRLVTQNLGGGGKQGALWFMWKW